MATLVPVAALLEVCNPLVTSPWRVGRVSEAMVRRCIRDKRFQPHPVGMSASRYVHAGRIAYFAVHGWDDSIDIDVGVPSMGCHVKWPVQDGNHRLAAAAVRGDEMIKAEIGGSIDYASELLDVDPGSI